MSMRDCIKTLMEGQPEGGKAELRRAQVMFDNFEQRYRDAGHTPSEAARRAGEEALEVLEEAHAYHKFQTALTAQRTKEIGEFIDNYRDANGLPNPLRAARALFTYDTHGRAGGMGNLFTQRAIVHGIFQAKFADALVLHRPKFGGMKRLNNENAIDEIFERGSTGDAEAQAIARAWDETAKFVHEYANMMGVRIPFRADWGLPQIHHRAKIMNIPEQEWMDDVIGWIDLQKMNNYETGRPFSRAELREVMPEIYESIITDGINTMRPGTVGKRMLANRRTDARFLVFKDAESWKAYMAKYGEDDYFTVMVGYLEKMARDVAAVEILGPNPDAMIRWITDYAKKAAVDPLNRKRLDRVRVGLHSIDEMWQIYTNRLNAGAGTSANVFEGVRNLLTAAQLPLAAITSISDFNTQMITAGLFNMPQMRLVGEILNQFNPLNIAGKRAAIQAGLVTESWSSHATAAARFVGEVTGPKLPRKIADVILRITALTPMYQGQRNAFGLELMGLFSRLSDTEWGRLPDGFARGLESYGITAADWDAFRALPTFQRDGGVILRPIDFLTEHRATARNMDLFKKFQRFVVTEQQYATIGHNLGTEQLLIGSTKPGTVTGMLARSFSMYKQFPVTVSSTHVMRGVTQQQGLSRARYFAQYLIGMTVMGNLALNLKEIAKGKEPKPIRNFEDAVKVGMASLLQGGGLGLFGDFIFAEQNRFGQSLPGSIAGPVAGLGGDILNLTVGSAQRAAYGEKVNLGRNAVRFAKRYTPGVGAPYMRIAIERLIFDEIQKMVDPEAQRQFRQQEKRMKKETGQDYWWRPGKREPE